MPTIVDLSHPFGDGTITYPGLPGPVISDHLSREESRARYADGYEFQIGRIDMVANTGTYLDTPFHRFADGHDLTGLELARVAAVPGVLIDASGVQEVGEEHLAGHDVAGRAVLVHTGWSHHWGTERYGDPSHSFIGQVAAKLLVDRGAATVGIDSVNIDDTRTGERPIHTLLLAAGIPIIEHLRGLDELSGKSFTFFALPPAISGVGTFPVRAIAVLDGT
jgi:kynurenine formamidase